MKKVFAFTISSFFVIDLLLFTLANIHTDDRRHVASSETIVSQNASKSANSSTVNAVTSTDGMLEPSPMDLVHPNEKIETKDETVLKIETENKNSVDENLSNDTPIVLTESSSLGLEPIGDVTLVVTSQPNDIQSKIAAQLERNIPENLDRNTSIVDKNSHETVVDNVEIAKENVSDKTSEDIPSFSEWAQKRLEEVEKSEQINSSAKSLKTQVVTGKGQNARLRLKNYASPDCGAKVVAANPEATHPGAILYTSEEYKLNPCTSRIWFVVELCEAIQPKRIEIANYELYSSSPKDFTLAVGDRYPSRDWTYIGKFTAKDEKTIQSFDVDTQIFGKYVKVEIKSHYGSEHYCPISLFRVYGTSVFEVLQKEDPANINHPDDDDDDDDDEDVTTVIKDDGKNLFVSAKDAVISIVKKAAEVLGNKVDAGDNNQTKQSNRSILINTCSSPIYALICHNCNETLFGQIYELLSCRSNEIKNLVSIPVIYKSLIKSQTCHNFGYELKSKSHNDSSYISHIESFFPMKYIVAMCNEAAILQNNAILNVSQHYFNATKNLTKDNLIYPPTKGVVNTDVAVDFDGGTLSHQNINKNITDTTKITILESGDDTAETATKIKPTKVLLVDPNLTQTEVPITTLDHPSSMLRPPTPEEISTNSVVETISSVVTEIPTKEINNVTTSSPSNNNVVTASTAAVGGDVATPESDTVLDTIEDHIDHIIADLNSDGQNTAAQSTINNNPSSSPQTPKESIFLRLSNRIKALERNMSLSAQYLEELSKRYKKQVEEIQNLLEKTIGSMRDENAKRNKHIEDRLLDLTITVESLTAERQFLASVLYCLILAIIVSVFFYFFCWKPKRDYKLTSEKAPEILRRKSMDDLNLTPKEKKKRRPSDQVLKIVRHASISSDEKFKKSKRKRKKTIIPLVRCNSTSSLGILKKDNSPDWFEETHNGLEHSIPFVLDESDNFILDSNSLPNYFAKSEILHNASSHERSKSEVKEIKVDNTPTLQYKRSNSESPNHIFMPQQVVIKKEKKGLKKFFKKVF